MPDFESGYNSFASRFGSTAAAGKRGSFARFLDDAKGSLGTFASSIDNTFQSPTPLNGQEETAYGDSTDARNIEQWGSNLNRVGQQQDQYSQLGFNSVSQAQAVQQAKEMAKLNAAGAQQSAMFSGISSGISILGGIGGAFKSGLFSPKPSTTANPIANMNRAASYYGI